ncbi:MAG: hypothetical protein IJ512_00310 [Ruminococcus sp.]|nr:hypothetical protein [Ruminococcus sp.]
MKRMMTMLTLLACMTALAACGEGSGAPATAQQKLSGSFSSGVTLETDDFTAEGILTRYDAGIWSMYFDAPSEVAGVQLDFSGDEVTASYKGLSFSVPQAAMPSKQLILQCIQALDETAQNPDITGTKKDDWIEVEGELEAGDYILCLDDAGSPAEFRMDNMGACISFHDFNANVQMTTTTTTIPSLVVTTSDTALTETQQQ